MLSKELLDILVCPETKEGLVVADGALINALNARIAQGAIKNRAGGRVTEKIDGGLVRNDRAYLYPVRNDIPIMLIDEALPLNET